MTRLDMVRLHFTCSDPLLRAALPVSPTRSVSEGRPSLTLRVGVPLTAQPSVDAGCRLVEIVETQSTLIQVTGAGHSCHCRSPSYRARRCPPSPVLPRRFGRLVKDASAR